MITLKSCPNCGSYKIVFFKALGDGVIPVEIIKGVNINAQIITIYNSCASCHLTFQNPQLSTEELGIYYGSGHYRDSVTKPPEGMDKSEEDRARVDSEIINKSIGHVGSHLDVGCGSGYLLKLVNADDKVGVDPDVEYIKFDDLEVYKDLSLVSQKEFDLVTVIHTLEHIPAPLKFLKKVTKFVKKGGYLIVEVPSFKTRGGPFGFFHLNYFEPDVLRLMCRKLGLTPIQTEFTPHLLLICKKDEK